MFVRVFEARIYHDKGESAVGMLHMEIGKKHQEILFFSDEGKKKKKNAITLATMKDIISELIITEIGISAKIGDKNAFRATMLMGGAKICYCSMVSFLKSRQTLISYEKFIPCYNEDVFIVEMGGILRISIADIILMFGIVRLKKKYQNKVEVSMTQKEIN